VDFGPGFLFPFLGCLDFQTCSVSLLFLDLCMTQLVTLDSLRIFGLDSLDLPPPLSFLCINLPDQLLKQLPSIPQYSEYSTRLPIPPSTLVSTKPLILLSIIILVRLLTLICVHAHLKIRLAPAGFLCSDYGLEFSCNPSI